MAGCRCPSSPKESMPPMQLNLQGGGTTTTKKQAVGLRIQIPPGRSLKDKPHTQKKKKKTERKQKHNSKKINQASNLTLSGTQLLSSAPRHGPDSRLPCCGPATPRRPCGKDEDRGWEGNTLRLSWFPTTPPPLMSLSILIASPLPEAWVLFLG